jgi:hypothetical protein
MTRAQQVATLKKLAENRARAKAVLVTTQNRAIANVVDLSLSLSESLEKGVREGSLPANGQAALATIDRMLTRAEQQTAAGLIETSGRLFTDSLNLQVDQIATFGTIPPRRLQALAQQFDATFRPDLVTESYNSWIRRVPSQVTGADRELRDVIARSVANGTDYRAAAKDFLERSTFEKTFTTAGQYLRNDVRIQNLPLIQQKIAPLQRAIRVMRTEMTRLDNMAGITFAESAGLDSFVNIGVGDERQSEICADATMQDPMSLADWRNSEWGLAPRHPYCRCYMQAVPPEIKANLGSPVLGEVGALAEQFA